MNPAHRLFSRPLCTPWMYDSSFKVPVRLAEPLWRSQVGEQDVAMEILSLCAYLESICKPSYTEGGGGRSCTAEFKSVFQPKANVIVEKMRSFLQYLSYPFPTLKEFLKRTQMAVLFPKTMSYINNPSRPIFHNQKSSIGSYFQQLGMLNQLCRMSHQLEYDATHLSNHKYMAHQFAVLYQSVNQAGPYLQEYKKEIEENFKMLKASLSTPNKDTPPMLSEDRKKWVHYITSALLDEVTTFPDELVQPMVPTWSLVQQCCS